VDIAFCEVDLVNPDGAGKYAGEVNAEGYFVSGNERVMLEGGGTFKTKVIESEGKGWKVIEKGKSCFGEVEVTCNGVIGPRLYLIADGVRKEDGEEK
jgi:hypothetical protein